MTHFSEIVREKIKDVTFYWKKLKRYWNNAREERRRDARARRKARLPRDGRVGSERGVLGRPKKGTSSFRRAFSLLEIKLDTTFSLYYYRLICANFPAPPDFGHSSIYIA